MGKFFICNATCFNDMPDFMADCFVSAVNDSVRQLTPFGKQPLASFEDVLENWESPATAAGFTWPGKKKREVIEDALHVSRNMLHRLKAGKPIYQPPAKLGFRGQLSPHDEPKVRPVWVMPFETLIIESLFGRNINRAL